jgi:transposase-like protein
MSAPRKYPAELRQRAIRLVVESRDFDAKQTTRGAAARVGGQLGIPADTLRGGVGQADVDAGRRPGVSTEESARVRQLEAELREARRANEILLAASSFFASMPS